MDNNCNNFQMEGSLSNKLQFLLKKNKYITKKRFRLMSGNLQMTKLGDNEERKTIPIYTVRMHQSLIWYLYLIIIPDSNLKWRFGEYDYE